MKSLQREVVTQRLLRFGALRQDVQHANLVGAGLAGVDDIALDLLRRDAVVDRLLARPLHRVQAGVHHQAAGTEQLAVELAQLPLDIALVPAALGRQLLGIQRPAF